MIECTNEFIYKKRRKKLKKSKLLTFFTIIAVIGVVWAYNRFVVFNLIVSLCKETFQSYSAEAVNTSVYDNLSSGVNYSDIVTVEKNSSGDIVLIEANSVLINNINRKIITKTMQIMSDKIDNGILIPAFSFTGISFITGYGPKVKFKSLSVSKVTSDFRSEFVSSGINQTLHAVYIDVICSVSVVFPFNKSTVEIVTPVLICESVLVGKVPEVYLNGKIFS